MCQLELDVPVGNCMHISRSGCATVELHAHIEKWMCQSGIAGTYLEVDVSVRNCRHISKSGCVSWELQEHMSVGNFIHI